MTATDDRVAALEDQLSALEERVTYDLGPARPRPVVVRPMELGDDAGPWGER